MGPGPLRWGEPLRWHAGRFVVAVTMHALDLPRLERTRMGGVVGLGLGCCPPCRRGRRARALRGWADWRTPGGRGLHYWRSLHSGVGMRVGKRHQG